MCTVRCDTGVLDVVSADAAVPGVPVPGVPPTYPEAHCAGDPAELLATRPERWGVLCEAAPCLPAPWSGLAPGLTAGLRRAIAMAARELVEAWAPRVSVAWSRRLRTHAGPKMRSSMGLMMVSSGLVVLTWDTCVGPRGGGTADWFRQRA